MFSYLLAAAPSSPPITTSQSAGETIAPEYSVPSSVVAEIAVKVPWHKPVTIAAALFSIPSVMEFFAKPRLPLKSDPDNDCVYLFQYPRTPVIPNLSSKCLALETYLRMHQVKYEIFTKYPWARSTGDRCLPFVELESESIGDVDLIASAINKKFGIAQPNAVPEETVKLESHIITTLWCSHFFRYSKENCALLFSEEISGKNSVSVPVVPHCRSVFIRLMMEGNPDFTFRDRKAIAKHVELHMKSKVDSFFDKIQVDATHDGICTLAKASLAALSDMLLSRAYFFHEKPTHLDARVFGVLAQILYVPINTPLQGIVGEFKNLVDFCENIRTKFWPDWVEILKTT